MPLLATCRCLFWLMRRYFLGRLICQPVSERFHLVRKCHLSDYSTYVFLSKISLISFLFMWVGLVFFVLWYINLCRLFNAKVILQEEY